MHPGKRIVIAEFGWPTAGYNFHDANPGRIEQAMIIRDFANWAEAYGIDYNIVEAIDQPWKTDGRRRRTLLGTFRRIAASPNSPGPARSPIRTISSRPASPCCSACCCRLPILAIAGVTVTQAAMLAVSANLVGAWFTAIVAFWKGHYFVPGAAFALGLGLLLLMPLIAIALSRLDEIAAIAFGRPPRRLANSPSIVPDGACRTRRPMRRKCRSTFRPAASRRTC